MPQYDDTVRDRLQIFHDGIPAVWRSQLVTASVCFSRRGHARCRDSDRPQQTVYGRNIGLSVSGFDSEVSAGWL